MSLMRNREEVRQNEALSLCFVCVCVFFIKPFLYLESHDCVDETDAAAICKRSSEDPACP